MHTRIRNVVLHILGFVGLALSASAAQVDFTGGTATLTGGGTAVTDGTLAYNVFLYEEDGFRMEAFGGTVTVGPYYEPGNDVIHGHWDSGDFGTLTKIAFSKIDGSAFDLNYFVLTSNTDTGGGAASGNEKVYLHASIDGETSAYAYLLPPEQWGFPGVNVFLGDEFNGIKAFWFEANTAVDCFGMDNFYIDEAAPFPNPSAVPEPGTVGLLFGGMLLMLGLRRGRR